MNAFGMISLADLLKLLDSDNSRLGSHSHAVDDIPAPTSASAAASGVGGMDEQALSTTHVQLGELYALFKGSATEKDTRCTDTDILRSLIRRYTHTEMYMPLNTHHHQQSHLQPHLQLHP